MYGKFRVLGVIPARGGSKGIPLKNIINLNGSPLLLHTLEFVSRVNWIDDFVVSTDHPEIASVAKKVINTGIISRPPHLSGDHVGDMPVLRHALIESESKYNKLYDIVLMLQPTSPLRQIDQIEKCISKLISNQLQAVWTVAENDLKFHPYKQLKINDKGKIEYFIAEGKNVITRQELSPSFHRSGICYAFTRKAVLESESVWIEDQTGAVITNYPYINIDTFDDLAIAERLLNNDHN